MSRSVVYVAVAVVLLAIVVLLVFAADREIKKKKLTPLAGLAFAFVVAGIIFSEEPVIGYGLMAVGAAFGIADMFRKRRAK